MRSSPFGAALSHDHNGFSTWFWCRLLSDAVNGARFAIRFPRPPRRSYRRCPWTYVHLCDLSMNPHSAWKRSHPAGRTFCAVPCP